MGHAPDLQFSQVFGTGFMFDVSNDPSELYNLLNPASPGYDGDVNRELVKKAQVLLDTFMREDELFSNPIDFLHARLPLGDPGLIGDGMWVRPFLDDAAYLSMLDKMFQGEERKSPQRRAVGAVLQCADDAQSGRQCVEAQSGAASAGTGPRK